MPDEGWGDDLANDVLPCMIEMALGADYMAAL
jgi:hypothetical protein